MILLGIFMIFIITEKSIPKKFSDAQLEGNTNTINNIIKELNLHGNAIFLPKSNKFPEERIFIPSNKSGVIRIPTFEDDKIIFTEPNGTNLGIAVPPSGLKLIREIEKDLAIEETKLEKLEEKLQLFVGLNLLKSVNFKKRRYGWDLEVEKLESYKDGYNNSSQYPCPICSAIITLITRALNEKIRIYDTSYNGKKIIFHLNMIKRRDE